MGCEWACCYADDRECGGNVTEYTRFGYHDRLINLELVKPAPTEMPCAPVVLNDGNNYSVNDSWTYRYGPGGIREQKRLMASPQHDRMPCGVAPWVGYVLSPGGQQLAVYHGRQVSESECNPASFGQYEHRVHIYPVEFRSYGPDGINVIFERNAAGVMVKRYVTTNNQGSIVSVTDNAGYEASGVYDNYGAPAAGYTRRTGWLDRERDFETSPLSIKHKLYDLEARKYNASTGLFLSVDPLWAMFISSSSYAYCEGDAANGSDPSGLADPLTPDPPGSVTPNWQTGSKHTVRDFNVWGYFDDEERAKRGREELERMGSGSSGGTSTGGVWRVPYKALPTKHVFGKGVPGPNRVPFTYPEVVVTAKRNGAQGQWLGVMATFLHYQIGGMKPMHVPVTSLDLSHATQKDLIFNRVTGNYSLDLLRLNPNNVTSLALRKISLTRTGSNEFIVNPDIYDFNIEWQNGFSKRNLLTALGYATHNLYYYPYSPVLVGVFGGTFTIYFDGKLYVKP